MLDNYCKTVLIEANTMIDMAKTEIAPAISAYVLELANTASTKKAVDAVSYTHLDVYKRQQKRFKIEAGISSLIKQLFFAAAQAALNVSGSFGYFFSVSESAC